MSDVRWLDPVASFRRNKRVFRMFGLIVVILTFLVSHTRSSPFINPQSAFKLLPLLLHKFQHTSISVQAASGRIKTLISILHEACGHCTHMKLISLIFVQSHFHT